MNSDKEICSVLTVVIRDNKPMLSDFQVSVTRSKTMTRPMVDVASKRIRIPQIVTFKSLMLMIGPMMDKACMQIEYDAHATNDAIDYHIEQLKISTEYLARYITLDTE